MKNHTPSSSLISHSIFVSAGLLEDCAKLVSLIVEETTGDSSGE